jgi:hypothetical protein
MPHIIDPLARAGAGIGMLAHGIQVMCAKSGSCPGFAIVGLSHSAIMQLRHSQGDINGYHHSAGSETEYA